MIFKTIMCYYDIITGEVINSQKIERGEYILTDKIEISYKKSIVANDKVMFKTVERVVKKNQQLKLKL